MKRSFLIIAALSACVAITVVSWKRNPHQAEARNDTAPSDHEIIRSTRLPEGGLASGPALSTKRSVEEIPQEEHAPASGEMKRFAGNRDSLRHDTNARTMPRSNRSSVADRAVAPEGDEPVASNPAPETNSPVLGVRLDGNVRLPAAAIPNDLKLTEVSRKALQDIVDDYYRELMLGVVPQDEVSDPGAPPTQTGRIEVADNGERTLVVTNGPVADAARKRADQRFRALFGNAAYNRLTMNAQIDLLMSAEAAR